MSDDASSPSSGETSGLDSQGPGVTSTPAPASTPAPDAAAAPSSGAPDAPSDASSPSTTTREPETLLDAIRDAVVAKDKQTPDPARPDADKGDAAARPDTTDTQAPQEGQADPAAEEDPSDAELAQLDGKTRRRIGRLLRQRHEARQALDAVQPELRDWRQLRGYLEQHQLASEDVNLLLGVGAALRRGDYKAFLDGIEPYRAVARQSLGLDVAPDLRGRVDGGEITEEAARELTRTRLEAARARAEAETQTQTYTQRDQTARVGAMREAIDTWEAGVKGRDPDYALKADAIRRTSQGLMAENGAPQTPQDAVAIAQRAYDEVTKWMVRAKPAPQPTRQAPASVQNPSLGVTREPRSMLDVVRSAMATAP